MAQLERVKAQLAFNEGRALDSQMSLSLYEEAIPNFTKAIQLAPDYAKPYYNRGISHHILGNITQANADETTACSLDSNTCDD